MCTGPHPYIPATNVAGVDLIYLQDAQRCENTLHFLRVAGWTPTDLTNLATALVTSWTSHIAPQMHPSCELTEVICTDLSTATGAQISLPASVAGSHGGVGLGNGVAFKLKFATGNRGRSYRGGVFHGGLCDAMFTGPPLNTLTIAAANAIRDGWANVLLDITTAGLGTGVITSFCKDGAWRATALSSQIASVVYTDRTVDHQDRRSPGRGN